MPGGQLATKPIRLNGKSCMTHPRPTSAPIKTQRSQVNKYFFTKLLWSWLFRTVPRASLADQELGPLANVGDISLIPSPGRSHVPRSNLACGPQLLSLCPKALELQLRRSHTLEPTSCNYWSPHALESLHHRKRRHRNEEPKRHSQRVAPARQSLCAPTKNQNR